LKKHRFYTRDRRVVERWLDQHRLHYRQLDSKMKQRDHFQKPTLELDKITLRCSYFVRRVKRVNDKILKRKLTYLETTNKKKL
jgi:hypothetical protein